MFLLAKLVHSSILSNLPCLGIKVMTLFPQFIWNRSISSDSAISTDHSRYMGHKITSHFTTNKTKRLLYLIKSVTKAIESAIKPPVVIK